MLANVTHIADFSSAVEFFEEQPYLTLNGLCELFNLELDDIKGYAETNEVSNEMAIFELLNEKGISDEEMIEEVLKNEKESYFVTYNDTTDDFSVYRID